MPTEAIYVAGSWGSGTTAMAGALHRLGLAVIRPTFVTNDERTADSFETVAFRNLVLKHVDESRLAWRSSPADLHQDMLAFAREIETASVREPESESARRLVLKLPLAAFCIPQMADVFDLKVVVVHRPLEDIEQSRRRRGWSESYGQAGAKVIYARLYDGLRECGISFLAVAFDELQRDPQGTLRKVISHLDIGDLAANLPIAVTSIRRGPAAQVSGRADG